MIREMIKIANTTADKNALNRLQKLYETMESGKENEENGSEGNGSAEDNGEFTIHD